MWSKDLASFTTEALLRKQTRTFVVSIILIIIKIHNNTPSGERFPTCAERQAPWSIPTDYSSQFSGMFLP